MQLHAMNSPHVFRLQPSAGKGNQTKLERNSLDSLFRPIPLSGCRLHICISWCLLGSASFQLTILLCIRICNCDSCDLLMPTNLTFRMGKCTKRLFSFVGDQMAGETGDGRARFSFPFQIKRTKSRKMKNENIDFGATFRSVTWSPFPLKP